MKKYSAILFDFDGVLGATMEDNFLAWRASVSDFGYTIRADQYYPLEGMNIHDLAKVLCRYGRIDEVHAEAIAKKKELHYLQNHTFVLYPSVEEIITHLHAKGIPIAIVSGARRSRLKQTVPSSFLSLFASIITTEFGMRGKPHPDQYLLGAKALGVDPKSTIVVENAPLGVQAAKNAGSYCVAITTTNTREVLSGADEIIENFRDLLSLGAIQSLLRA